MGKGVEEKKNVCTTVYFLYKYATNYVQQLTIELIILAQL